MATQSLSNDKNNPQAIPVDEGYSIFKYILIVAALVIAGVIGFNIYQSGQDKAETELGNLIYQFQENSLKPVLDKKEGADLKVMASAFQKLFSHKAARSGALTVESIKVSDILIDGSEVEMARDILKVALKNSGGDLARFFVISRLGVIEQNMGNTDEAIRLYESLLKQKISLMTDKIYLDLGVLYLKKGNSEKGKASLNYVIEKSKDETLLKLARIYLNK